MFNITDKSIIEVLGNINTFVKAKQYYTNKRVKSLQHQMDHNIFTSIVQGTKSYEVKIKFDKKNRFTSAMCDCPAYFEYHGGCKHVGAVLLVLAEKDKEGIFDRHKDEEFTQMLFNFFNFKTSLEKKPVTLEIKYEFSHYNSMLSFYIGESKLYKLRNIKALMTSIEDGEGLSFGKHFTFNPYEYCFKEEDVPIFNFLQELYENEKLVSGHYYSGSFLDKDKANLTSETTKRFFKLIKDRPFKVEILGTEFNDVKITEERIPLNIKVSKDNDDVILDFDLSTMLIPLVDDGEYFFYKERIYRVPQKQKEYLQPFLSRLIKENKKSIKIPSKHTEKFVSEVLPFIAHIGEIKTEKAFESSIYKPQIRPEIYFDATKSGISADVKFVYGDITLTPFSKEEKNQRKDGMILIRDLEAENRVISLFDKYGFIVMKDKIHIEEEDKVFDFIYYGINELQKEAEIFYSDDFKAIRIKDMTSFSGGVRLNNESNLLEFTFDIEGINRSELVDLFSTIKEKRRYYKLKDGSFLPLNINELDKMQDLFQYLDLSAKDLAKEKIEIPKFRALFIDDYIRETDNHYLKRDLKFKELVQNIKEPGDIDYSLPESLKNVLREYQAFGFKWLKTLSAFGFGGILADDMGLGKTLQVLAFLLSEKLEKGDKPSLVVAPTSLVYNWAAEVEKFTSELKTLIISGSKDEREEYVGQIEDYDIVITSYPLIRRDTDLYEKTSFRHCILDEAQHIKNPMSIGAKSVKTLKAENYFALTGTPIENSLIELWSIFDFLMPGYLLSQNKFKKRFETPIIKDKDLKVLDKLKQHLRPFILRRMKKEVLNELPEKIETKVVAEMSLEQKKLYLSYLHQIKGEINKEIKEKGFEKSHIKILAGLTRLRQICCDPSMFIEGFNGESGKLSLLNEIIDDALESCHRILLFSQFTTMLKIIRTMLERKKITYKYLDGSTPGEERGRMVNEFNSGQGEIFLISLKAGGTGLNLTGADTVIHYDPWWNPAVEDQATDRAYRIGQKNSVQVMKLITKGTIEEKIYELQEKKRQMIDTVIKPGETLVSKLTEEEIKSLFNIL